MPLPPAAIEPIELLVGSVRAELDRRATQGRRSEVRWVRLEGLHVTLRFLGATDAGKVDTVAEAVGRGAAGHAPLDVSIRGAGAFPSPGRPRTLWLRVVDGERELEALAASVDRELVREGWQASERPFRPHLTLARADGRREGPDAARLLAAEASELDVRFAVERVVLFESVTGRGPARYVPLREAALGG